MGFIKYNSNPIHKRVGDCVIRAISVALDQDWDTTYTGIVLKGFEEKDMPSGNAIWGAYLKEKGFERNAIPADLVGWYTVEDFANEHKSGVYILAIDGHVVCVKDGNYYDTWQSGDETPVYYWAKK